MGWEALELWGKDAVRIKPLAGGVANDVWSVHIHGQIAVGRLGTRSNADLAWEVELLRHLDREGLSVPVPIPADDGRLFADGLMVMTYMHGGPPETEGDWRRVAETLRELHRLTSCMPRRGRGSTLPRCRQMASLDAARRGHGLSDVRHASSTVIPTTLPTSA